MNPVLVDDDNPRVLDALERGLAILGYPVVPASTADEALGCIGSVEFSVALIDLRLPGLNGHGLMRKLKEIVPELPIIAMSGLGTMDDVIEVLRDGAIDYLRKPIKAEELARALQRAFELPRHSGDFAAVKTATEEQEGPTPEDLLAEAIEKLESDTEPLPPAAPLLPDVRRLMGDLTAGLDEVLAVIDSDPAVAAEVLRSAQQMHAVDAGSLKDICLRLGNRRVLATAHEVLLRGQLAVEGPLKRVGDKLWRNARVTARGAQVLAELMKLPDPDSYYVAGLLHNVGEVVMLRGFATHLEQETIEDLGLPKLAQAIADRHELLGRRVLEGWQMPESLVQLACFHHRESPTPLSGEDKVRLHAVLGAWGTALQLGFTYLPGAKEDPAPHIAMLRLDPADVRRGFRRAKEWAEG